MGNALHVSNLCARDIVVGVGHSVGRCTPAVGNGWRLNGFAVDEEEQLVLNDWTAESETIGGAAVGVTCTVDGQFVDSIAAQVFVAVVDVGTAFEGVCSRFGDGIHAAADEVCLAHIKGRDYHLQFVDGINRDGVAAAGKFRTQAEVVVEVGAVNGEIGRSAVRSGKEHAVATIGRQARYIGDAAAHGGQVHNLTVVDVG